MAVVCGFTSNFSDHGKVRVLTFWIFFLKEDVNCLDVSIFLKIVSFHKYLMNSIQTVRINEGYCHFNIY